MDTLPEIPMQKQSLTGKQAPHSTSFEDPGLRLDETRESLAVSGRHNDSAGGTAMPQSSGGILSPRPPASFGPSPRPVQSRLRRSLDSAHVRLSRDEFNRKEQLISSLRADNLELQQKTKQFELSRDNSVVLQSVLSNLAQSLDCDIEGVTADSVHDILRGRITKLSQDHRQVTQQMEKRRDELERTREELAATNVKYTNMESQLIQCRSELEREKTEVKQLKSDMENLQQTCARTGATIQLLRQQLGELEENKTASLQTNQVTRLQTELGRLKSELGSKNNQIEGQRSQLSDRQADLNAVQERATLSDAMYAELCTQLVEALQLESSKSFDTDHLISQVSNLHEECSELRLRMDTVTKTMKTVELDSKANRETILQLVAEAKKHEAQAIQLADFQRMHEETKVSLCAVEEEKEGLEERLNAAKETLVALERELQAKESKIKDLSENILSLQTSASSEHSLVDSAEHKYQDLCESLAAMVGSQTRETSVLLSLVEQLVNDALNHVDGLSRQSTQLSQLEQSHYELQEELAYTREALNKEGAKVKLMEAERMSGTILSDGLAKKIEKHKSFIRRLSKAVNLDSCTAEILSGDFAHDAILTKAEQMAKQETQLLAERKSAIYSLQRKLKTCRQALDNKELHLGLVQKKVTIMEERLLNYTQKEREWKTVLDKMQSMEKQVERLQYRATQQKEAITLLRVENADMQKLKAHCKSLEDQLAHVSSSLEEVTKARVRQAQQLAEARQRQVEPKVVQSVKPQEKAKSTQLVNELAAVREEMNKAKQKESELCAFRAAVNKLLEGDTETVSKEDAPDDHSLITRLERLVASRLQYRETNKCLEASLKQLESGFKSSYNDALSLLVSGSSREI